MRFSAARRRQDLEGVFASGGTYDFSLAPYVAKTPIHWLFDVESILPIPTTPCSSPATAVTRLSI